MAETVIQGLKVMLRLLDEKSNAISLAKHRPIKDRLAVSLRYRDKLIQDLEYVNAKKRDLEILIESNDKDINHWRFWDRQEGALRAVMEKIPTPKNKK